jgi:subtilisin family serine protease
MGKKPRNIVAIGSVLVLPVLAVLCLTSGPQAAAQAPGDRVSPQVHEALQAQAKVSVIIALREPGALKARPIDLPALRREAGAAQARVLSALTAADFDLRYRYQALPALAGDITASGAEKLAAHADVLGIYADWQGQGALSQSVPLINADDVHAQGYTGEGVVVAVLDTGLDTDHPDLSDDLLFEECFLAAGNDPRPRCPNATGRQSGPGAAQDDNGHGTNVTGIITSKGTVAHLGVAPDASIAAYKVIDANNVFWGSDVLAALDHIINNHPEVDVVNMSLGTWDRFAGYCDNVYPPVTTAIETLRANGAITFASSGNEGDKGAMPIPACISSTVSVGAVYDSDLGREPDAGTYRDLFGGNWPACFDSPTGPGVVTCFSNSDTPLDILAPGTQITSTGMGGSTSTYRGTSQASPHAAGCAALELDANPALTPDQIESRLESTGVALTDPGNGLTRHRIDCYQATFAPMAVGGIAELPDVSGSSAPNYVLLAGLAAAAILALTAGAWYARRRWLS